MRVLRNLEDRGRDVIEGVRNLFKWRKAIWSDRDFDYYFLYAMIEKKLRHMKECHENTVLPSENTDDNIYDIEKARYSAELLAEERFNEMALYTFGYEPDINTLLQLPEGEFRRVVERADEIERHHRRQLFDTMRDNVEKWWD